MPALPSNRVANVYAVSDSSPLALEIAPLPPFRLPFQTADALLSMCPPEIPGASPRGASPRPMSMGFASPGVADAKAHRL